MDTIRVLLADDNRRFMDATSQFLAQALITVVGRVHSGLAAVTQTALLKPDLVLMDIAMPYMDGLDATRRIKAQPNPPRVIILTLHDSPIYASEARAAGADQLVTKAAMGRELLPAIRLLFVDEKSSLDESASLNRLRHEA